MNSGGGRRGSGNGAGGFEDLEYSLSINPPLCIAFASRGKYRYPKYDYEE
jgi:hypothetical protein